jgi:hypothetical protein
VDRGGAQPLAIQLLREAIRAVGSANKDERPLGARTDLGEHPDLVVGTYADEALLERLHRLGRRGNLVVHRVVLVAAHERAYLAVERRREQQCLRLAVDLLEDALDLRQEAHVGHLVGFVDDDHLDLRERKLATLEQVVEAPRRRDDDVDAGL